MQQPVGVAKGSGVMSKPTLGVISVATGVTVQGQIMEAILQLGMSTCVGGQSQFQSKEAMRGGHRQQAINTRGRANRIS